MGFSTKAPGVDSLFEQTVSKRPVVDPACRFVEVRVGAQPLPAELLHVLLHLPGVDARFGLLFQRSAARVVDLQVLLRLGEPGLKTGLCRGVKKTANATENGHENLPKPVEGYRGQRLKVSPGNCFVLLKF